MCSGILFFSYVNQRSRYISVELDTLTIRTGSWFDTRVPEEDLNDRPIIGADPCYCITIYDPSTQVS